jgi:hypothetical protein
MSKLPAEKISPQQVDDDTPIRGHRTTSAFRSGVKDGIRQRGRRTRGGWHEVPEQSLAAELLHPDGTPYTTRHVRNGVADLRAAGELEVIPAPRRWDGQRWHRDGHNRYRIISGRRRRRADRKQVAGHAVSGAPPSDPTLSRVATALRSTPECEGCGVPIRAQRHLWPCVT